MPVYLKNIEAKIIEPYNGELTYATSVAASIQFEDYINLNNFIAYLQNFKNVSEVEYLNKPLEFGLKNNFNSQITTLQISY
jgi:hypothetical protein